MKQLRTFATTAGFVLIAVFVAPQVLNSQPGQAIRHQLPNSIRYVGVDGDMLVFELSLNEIPAEGCQLRILDESHAVIYEERIRSARYAKRYKIVLNGISRIQF